MECTELKCKKVVLNGIEYTPKGKDFFIIYITEKLYFYSYNIEGIEDDFSSVLKKKDKNIISLYCIDSNNKDTNFIELEVKGEDIMLYEDDDIGYDYYGIIFEIYSKQKETK